MPIQSLRSSSPTNFSTSFIAEQNVIWCGISLWSVGISSPSSVPSHLLVHHQPTHCWGEVRSRKGLDALWAVLSNNKNITGLSTGCAVFSTNPKRSCIPAIVKESNSTSAKVNIYICGFWPRFYCPCRSCAASWKFYGQRLRTNVYFLVPLTNWFIQKWDTRAWGLCLWVSSPLPVDSWDHIVGDQKYQKKTCRIWTTTH